MLKKRGNWVFPMQQNPAKAFRTPLTHDPIWERFVLSSFESMLEQFAPGCLFLKS